MRLCILVLVVSCGAQLGDPTALDTASGSDDVPGGNNDNGGNVTNPPDAAPPPTVLDACCHQRAHCVATSQVPESAFLDQDSCDADQVCVPDQFLDADPISACSANSFALGDYTGVCLSDCLHFGIAAAALDNGDCGSHELCVPCSVNGQSTQAPGCP